MHEEVLRKFFEENATATELAQDVAGSTKQTSETVSVVSIVDMDSEFTVTSDLAIKLCDAVLRGEIPPDALEIIGFALSASERFCWDGDSDEVLAEVIADWSCPEVNYRLTLENVKRFRAWLMRTEPYPAKPSLTGSDPGTVFATKIKSI
jgi:hypothetical protein